MSRRDMMCAQTLKFVVVGDPSSGKTTLIKRFLLDFRGDITHDEDDTDRQSYICDGHTIVLNATAKNVRRDGSSVALKDRDIARQLWHKKFSQSKSLPRKFQLKPEHWNDISWDEIFVYLHKLPNIERIITLRDSARERSNEMVVTDRTRQNSPEKPSRSYVYRRSKDGKIKPSQSRKGPDKSKSEVTEIIVDIWDTGGDKSVMWHQWYECTGADAVLFCVPLSLILRFDERQPGLGYIDKHDTISSSLRQFLTNEFLTEKSKNLKYRVPPVLLVGTRSDQCESVTNQRRSVFEAGESSEIDNIGLRLAAEIGCCDFVYCSGLRGNRVASVFEAALAVSLTTPGKYRASDIPGENTELMEQSDCESSLSGEVACPTYFKVHTYAKSEKMSYEPNEVFDESSSSSECADEAYFPKRARSPPQIFFPPPPDTTPPSTLPNSSDSSFEYAESLKSTDSTAEKDVTNENNRALNRRVMLKGAQSASAQNLAIGNRSPVPAPRKRIISDRKPRDKSLSPLPTPSNAGNIRTTTENMNLMRREAPSPKPRRSNLQANRKEYKADKSRRESIFLKFLQAK